MDDEKQAASSGGGRAECATPRSALSAGAERLVELPLDVITVRLTQVRHKANEREGLDELKAAIAQEGFNSAVLVQRLGEKFELVAGHRRYYAAVEMGLTSIPCIIRKSTDEFSRTLAQLNENLKRKDLNPVETADAFAKLMEGRPGADQKAVAAEARVLAPRFSEMLRVARLPSAVKCALVERRVPEASALIFGGLYDLYRKEMRKEQSAIERTVEIIGRYTRDGWSSRLLRQHAAREKERLGVRAKQKRVAATAGIPSRAPTGTAPEVGPLAACGMRGVSPGTAITDAPAAAVGALFEATDDRLIVNKKYLVAGSANGEEKASLNRELTELILVLRRTPTRKGEAGV
jgi:ParB/RepB/Spo0J family partition protein